jgi:hypothetical protein
VCPSGGRVQGKSCQPGLQMLGGSVRLRPSRLASPDGLPPPNPGASTSGRRPDQTTAQDQTQTSRTGCNLSASAPVQPQRSRQHNPPGAQQSAKAPVAKPGHHARAAPDQRPRTKPEPRDRTPRAMVAGTLADTALPNPTQPTQGQPASHHSGATNKRRWARNATNAAVCPGGCIA